MSRVTHRPHGQIRLGRFYPGLGYVAEAGVAHETSERIINSLMPNAGYLVVAGEIRVEEFA
jgi:hypothetical protein